MRAKAFYDIVHPYFESLNKKILIDFCCGNGKAGAEFDSYPCIEKIIFVDIKEPNKFKQNTANMHAPFEVYLKGIENFDVPNNSLVIALHSCGILTDKILEKAVLSCSPVAVMPCCYNQNMKKYKLKSPPDNRKLIYPAEKDYFDAFRLQYLKENGYNVFLERIDKKITPMNNVIIGIP